jgi:hypothetical protein
MGSNLPGLLPRTSGGCNCLVAYAVEGKRRPGLDKRSYSKASVILSLTRPHRLGIPEIYLRQMPLLTQAPKPAKETLTGDYFAKYVACSTGFPRRHPGIDFD